MFAKIQKRSVGHAFKMISRANQKTTYTRTVKVPMQNWFILSQDYDFDLKRTQGMYQVKSFTHETGGDSWMVTIYDCWENDGTSYYRIEAVNCSD